MAFFRLCLTAVFLFTFAGCGVTDKVYYSTMGLLGKEKRDILVDKVEDAQDAQADASEQFQTTYERFQELTGFDGGELEDRYNALKDALEDAEDRAGNVRGKIESVEDVAEDLFAEWERELDQFSSAELRANSERQLRDTRARFDRLMTKMREAESSMEPVLTRFNDYVLALKHNLNAQAIGSLEGTAAAIDGEIAALIADMQASIAEADAFLAEMNP